ncbi:DedA family protein [Aggregicoccus sp. 17bor-14]|uniref:DedA family protein n=1 Tax=Myxococcaceae TaxID=31 RepID=UPI00129CABB0|nr:MULTISPECIES: DedA family protein [Myxococcaceae]MBF5046191.1 DedA family protein [Simulacricoccus sp. 17bor-14]MRI91916.1 DedA family protein [Aggregicoccus sp. 17bor-14]
MIEQLDHFMSSVGPFAYLVLALAAMLEYVVPPFPGDSVVLLGGVYAVRGDHPWWGVFLAVLAGSALGLLCNYRIGIWLARRFDRDRSRAFFGLTHAQLESLQDRMRLRGGWLLLINRFLPGIRGAVFIAAGASRMPIRRCLVLGLLSATAHTGLVLWAGYAVGGNLERLTALFNRYQHWVLIAVAGVAVFFVARALVRRSRARRQAS